MTDTQEIPAFPKVWAIGNRFLDRLFVGPVEITEKIDGSQFSFGRINGEFQMRSKGRRIYGDDADSLFKGAAETAISLQHKIPDDMVVHGEAIYKPKHNVLTYGRVPHGNIIIYAVRTSPGQFGNSRGVADALGLEHVPVLFEGEQEWNSEKFLALLETESILGKEKIEGVVIKNYKQDLLIGGQYIPITCAKFVSEKFKERHSATNYGASVAKNGVIGMGLSLCSEARWLKAVQHLRDDGKLVSDVQDIGPLFKEIHRDIDEEEKENIKEELWKLFSKDLKRAATKGLPEWYKERLLAENLGENPDD